MRVDAVLILAAGKGTRMGSVGKEVPKVLWPIFNKSILELEVDYARQFNPSSIYINVYNHKEKVLDYIKKNKSFDDINILEEQEKLDIGGAVHNLARQLNYKGKLLVINSDQFIHLNQGAREEFLKLSEECDVAITTHSVDRNLGYSVFKMKGNKILDIVKPDDLSDDEPVVTYTGMSLINLSALTPTEGQSSFFAKVANYKELNVESYNVDDFEYWDFGTTERYVLSMKALVSQESDFHSFLIGSGISEKSFEQDPGAIRITDTFFIENEEVKYLV